MDLVSLGKSGKADLFEESRIYNLLHWLIYMYRQLETKTFGLVLELEIHLVLLDEPNSELKSQSVGVL